MHVHVGDGPTQLANYPAEFAKHSVAKVFDLGANATQLLNYCLTLRHRRASGLLKDLTLKRVGLRHDGVWLKASKKRFAQTFGGLKSPVEVMLKPLIENPHQTFRLGKRRRQETRDVITLMWQPALFIEQHSRIGPCQKEEKDADRKSEVCAGIISVRALRTELRHPEKPIPDLLSCGGLEGIWLVGNRRKAEIDQVEPAVIAKDTVIRLDIRGGEYRPLCRPAEFRIALLST
jgi:hypothetical protein